METSCNQSYIHLYFKITKILEICFSNLPCFIILCVYWANMFFMPESVLTCHYCRNVAIPYVIA